MYLRVVIKFYSFPYTRKDIV